MSTASLNGSMKSLEFISFLDRPDSYSSIWEFQKRRVSEIASGNANEVIIFCEHERLLTLGRRAKDSNVLDSSLPSYSIERGGDVTLHGPGQLVVYPILKLNSGRFPGGLHDFLRFFEQILIDQLASLGLTAGRFGPTGVWIRRTNGEVKKIASLGIAVQRWITYHGLAVNISNDLRDFKKIRPCDFDAEVMTSLHNEGIEISLREFADKFKMCLEREVEKRETSVQRLAAHRTSG
jgi:lipoyl(octanoyl) transferase